MSRIYSGIQPTGIIHLGNYLGAIRKLVELQEDHDDLIVCVADLHSLTVEFDPKTLAEKTLNTVAMLIACGIKKSNIYIQSSIDGHERLAWVFNCFAKIGELNRMTQFKDKGTDGASSGLYVYPNLMAADILLFKASHVPVGDDQKQHIQMTNVIGKRFNNLVKEKFFPYVKPIVPSSGSRIMSLQTPTKKMSKSDPSTLGRINLNDSNDIIVKKIKKARTDSMMLPETTEELEKRDGVHNLFSILSAVEGETIDTLVASFSGKGSSVLKNSLSEALIEKITPIRDSYNELIQNKDCLTSLMRQNAAVRKEESEKTLLEIKKLIGIFH